MSVTSSFSQCCRVSQPLIHSLFSFCELQPCIHCLPKLTKQTFWSKSQECRSPGTHSLTLFNLAPSERWRIALFKQRKLGPLFSRTEGGSRDTLLLVHLSFSLLFPSLPSSLSTWKALCHFGYVMGNKDEKLDCSLGPQSACRLHPPPSHAWRRLSSTVAKQNRI